MFVLKAGSGEVQLIDGDITKIAVDAIVNAANSDLAGGGGVDGAIHAAGGASIMQELKGIRARMGRCPAGNAVATGAGLLPAQFVFHAVGPVYRGGTAGEPLQLESATALALTWRPSAICRVSAFPRSARAFIAIRFPQPRGLPCRPS